MGACFGVLRVKKIAAADFYETFAHSLYLVHQSIRRAVFVATYRNRGFHNVYDYMNYFDYCKVVVDFLETYRVECDKYLFPFMITASNDQALVEKEANEHKTLEQLVATVNDLLRVGKTLTSCSDADVKEREKLLDSLLSQFLDMQKILVGDQCQLARLESKFTAANFRKWNISEASLRKLNDEMHAIIPQFMDRMDHLIFIIYHLDDEEKAFWDERIPCIVTKFSFPRKANERFEMWSWAKHARFNKGKSKCSWNQE